MSKGRLEAFSDGVLAIIITIMVLELKVPHTAKLSALAALAPAFMSYVLSFIFVGIYWNNHHHMLQTIKYVNGRTLWANMYLLFWLSLIPFATAWMGENNFAEWPVALYGFVLLMCAIAYTILGRSLVALHGSDSTLAKALGRDRKGMISLVCYVIALPLCFVNTLFAALLFVGVAIMWLIPDSRIERTLSNP